MLFTRKGDDGTSRLFGRSGRIPKNSPLFEALGTLDELNSLLGVCYAKARAVGEIGFSITSAIRGVQQDLFIVQAELAGAPKTLTQSHVDTLEHSIGEIETLIQNPHAFVISGATELSALLDVARSVSRRTERRVLMAQDIRKVSDGTRKYLNRLSSILYALARLAAQQGSVEEENPSY
ncbi:cob(I)yrinic acid a,c-diamide adenosyltransferase [Candidatus Kaiserbacteria bacterium]|nr:cob(I)yrinic acid a,c-diamide adenosyltransferase [Candidatus Kaiserbacteria bacterium]